MEAVGASASILTFITVAFSVTQSIHSGLSAIKDGPEVIRSLTREIAQLESVLQRLKQIPFASINDIDKSQLKASAKRCKGDLAELDHRLKSLDVSTSDGRRGRLWRKLKLCFSEKELDHIRNAVQSHLHHLTIQFHIIQARQMSLTATQSTQILSDLQHLKEEIAALRINSTATMVTEQGSLSTSGRVTEVDDEEMGCSPDTSLDESINRLMRLLEKKPCVVESDDSEELLKDIEHLLDCIRNDAEPAESEGVCQNCSPDVSKELRLMANIILSSPSMMINQTDATKRFWRPAGEQLLISQEPKRKAFETEDGVVTVTTTKRHRKSPREGKNEKAKDEARRDFLAKLTYTSKRTKKMLTLSVNQGQLLLNSFSCMLPCITICNILPINSLVFDTARNDTVQDLVGLFEGGKAGIHDHDINGWSLLHHSVQNLPVLKYLIEQGLDIDEVASRPELDQWITPSHLALIGEVPPGHYEALLHAGADVTLEVGQQPTAVQWITNFDTEARFIIMKRTLDLSPFVYANSSACDWETQDLIPRVCLNAFIGHDSEKHQALQQVRLLVEKGYDVNRTLNGQAGLHHLFLKSHVWLEWIPEFMDLLSYLIEHGADLHAEDYDGYQPWHYAYGATCEACYLFCPSAKGDLWDAVLTYLGYDILEKRKGYPRKARYATGYTRGDFQKLWHGQEGKCPYWDDQLWPPASEQSDTASSSWSLTRGNLCEICRPCMDDPLCLNCGVCLSSFKYFCEDDNHQHDRLCPREQVAVWELQEEDGKGYWKLVYFSGTISDYDVSSSEDSEDGGILLQDRLEEAFSDASAEEVS
ncbi:uncharacterized protein FFUJ_14543 [Fusarium fujikuroi IMI 58289]|uniref:Azaphilone pigments biosynthesis cluster protein L N-terminal domain-containing protein n=1 Tax=Gibberella fujikuroi (strain CBS 195.34 / IMI 58289 / NRRL A-6831) TaxID=1279085 RepID=S0DZ60_GIBF5|nr:uncharacterized protein FFUJ_14543 [Fusarium fujikuroi IMI 58289]QGI94476.1 hypothetical protein CEK26_007545 [Fusarium fujikuroi]CCT67836.1 uncharacterized protein FFUJ_14543 [Fusarium fujikuroi IMI 58289]SCO21535.1 uncharacterized protein FFM5_12673 [Fusarium fujikuroi]